MSLKSKGINAERELIHKFWGTGIWSAVRVAGSGSMKYPSADILAANKLRRLAIECKITKEQKKYFGEKEIDSLKKFAGVFGAEPWIAVKFKGHEWLFISLDNLSKTNKGYVIDSESVKSRGLLFEEIIEKK